MTVKVFFAAFAAWASFVIAAALIGLLASGFLRVRFGSVATHAMEISMLIVAIYALTFILVDAHGIVNVRHLFGIGIAWVVLTLGLELLIGYFGMGESWARVRRFFKIKAGQLYSIVLLALLVSPYLASLHVAAIQH